MGVCVFLIFLFCGMVFPSSGDNTVEELKPDSMGRILKILMPVPEDEVVATWHHVGSYSIPLGSETEICRTHSSFLFDSFLNKETWALRMVDASSKPGAGILDGNVQDLGNYDECVAVSAPHGQFRGKHCIVETRGLIPPEKIDKISPPEGVVAMIRKDVMFSVCVPDSCTAQDVKTHMNEALNSVNASALMSDRSCTTAMSQPLDQADYFAILVLLTIVVLIAVSTLYEQMTAKAEQKELLTSFSITSNTAQLLSTTVSRNSLSCLHGLRVFAMAWIILGHRFSNINQVPYRNIINTMKNLNSLAWTPMQSIHMIVEIFFLLSGILAAYNFFRDRLKGKRFNYLSFFVHRYLRLTPPMLMVMMLYATLLIRVTDGPMWRRMFGQFHESCQQNWWINLLYISNYVVPFKVCVRQTWYVMVDFQLHMLSPLLLMVIHRNRYFGFLLAAFVFLASNTASLAFVFWNGISVGGGCRSDRRLVKSSFTEYIQTHYRLTTFIIGLGLGYLLFRIKQQHITIKLSKPQLWTGWTVATLLFLGTVLSTSVFDDPEFVHLTWVDALYLIVRRTTLAFSIAWVVFACIIGRGGIVDKVLSWKALIPLSRLTYCVYLVHFFVEYVQIFSTRTPITINTLDIWYLFFGDFMASYLLAAILYLGVEAPASNVFNCLFRDSKKPTDIKHKVVLLKVANP